VIEIAQSQPDIWRFLSFDKHPAPSILNRRDWYSAISHICKPLLISLARLFFTIFRECLQVRALLFH
jgi:hypothetical protein